MSAHTPGPWREIDGYRVYSALGADSGDGAEADSNDAWCICICKGDEVPMTGWGGTQVPLGWGPTTANAKLIAAAPDLLESCKALDRLVVMVDCLQEFHPVVQKARAAIAKAEGRE